jgi:putative endonuclease
MAGPLSRPSMVQQAMGFVYIVASKPYGTLYTGVTSELIQRVSQHKEGLIPGFTKRYNIKMLVWYEQHGTIDAAIQRETSIKRWPRQWKINLIERTNPHWSDLFPDLLGP